jgi:hypothetical protein
VIDGKLAPCNWLLIWLQFFLAFSFNTESMFTGSVRPEHLDQGDALVYPSFLATKFIEVKPGDIGLVKFSGPRGHPIHHPDNSHLNNVTLSLECFTHYVLDQSQNHLLLADLQGTNYSCSSGNMD